MSSNRRRNLMVDTEFHRKMFGRVLFVSLLGVLFMALSVYFLASEEIERSFFSIHQGVRHAWEILMPAVFIGGGISLVLSTLAIYYLTLLQAHRIGGPIHRILQCIDELKKGNLSVDISLRKDDYLHEIADALRELIHSNRERLESLKDDIESLKRELSRIEKPDNIHSSGESAQTSSLGLLREKIERIERDLEEFKAK